MLKGIALARLNQCEAARGPARPGVAAPAGRGGRRRRPRSPSGAASSSWGTPPWRRSMFARVAESADPVRRREARLLRGRALRLTGRHRGGRGGCSKGSTDPRAADERLLALAGAGQRDAALALADSLLALRDTHGPMGHGGRGRRAGGTRDGVGSWWTGWRAAPACSEMARARMLLEDGLRLASVDTARADGAASPGRGHGRRRRRRRAGPAAAHPHWTSAGPPRLPTSHRSRPDARRSGSGGRARWRAEARQLRADPSPGSWPPVTRRPPAPPRPTSDSSSLRKPRATRSRLPPSPPRSSVASSRRRPDSPYAPKAILAGQALDPAWGESARAACSRRGTRPAPTWPTSRAPSRTAIASWRTPSRPSPSGAGSGAGAPRAPSDAPAADSLPTRPGALRRPARARAVRAVGVPPLPHRLRPSLSESRCSSPLAPPVSGGSWTGSWTSIASAAS